MSPSGNAAPPAPGRWTRLAAVLSSGFRGYAAWLVAITWRRFILLSILLLIIAGVLSDLPPFSWKIADSIQQPAAEAPAAENPKSDAAAEESIGEEIRREITEELRAELGPRRVRAVRLGDFLPEFALLLIFVSAAIKIAYAGRAKAEARAAEETLKRQVVEARMAAMQAQVEPHFLFNTLASIDHLIEVDPPRASTMQKNLIALLRAAMPAMREASATLGRELQVVRPYLEILRIRMQERLRAEVAVPEGLHSADFPPMMLQSLVENAIKHGLEPKPEGGELAVHAEVVHGKLAVTVADTGVGFGRAPTAGTGTGLSGIRERLKLLYGSAAELRIAANSPSGTRVSIVVPYKTADGASRNR
jgi:signal transduction histidine kinase